MVIEIEMIEVAYTSKTYQIFSVIILLLLAIAF